jgi:hypothetical protein
VRKVVIARSIWEATTMNMNWVAANLVMRSAANPSQQIRHLQKRRQAMPKELREWINQSRNVA